jgi:hypothetical protein
LQTVSGRNLCGFRDVLILALDGESVEIPAGKWPVHLGAAASAVAMIAETHVARKINAFDAKGDLIGPLDYETFLRGATVIMKFTLERGVISPKLAEDGELVSCERFYANIGSIRVIIPPPKVSDSPKLKRLYQTDPFTPSLNSDGKKRKIM